MCIEQGEGGNVKYMVDCEYFFDNTVKEEGSRNLFMAFRYILA
jgi:hypothetical protein